MDTAERLALLERPVLGVPLLPCHPELIAELATRWDAGRSTRHERRHGARKRNAGAGPKYTLVFTDRVLVTLVVHLCTGLSHKALGVIYEVGSSTIGRAISEIRRPLAAARGFAVPDQPGFGCGHWRDVFAPAAAENVRWDAQHSVLPR
ncbi:hypothetical protein AB0D13_15255 [Streptomyces sp. NPDC048430]|uniref:hypothetical protein n=1 Tax=Streptomyces sp. NPDC048430 TaxID=3155388 RepID=UPI00343326FF